MAPFKLTVRTVVRGYHVYKEVWALAIGKEFVCHQDRGSDHDRHAVSVHEEEEDVLGHLPREISSVAFFFLEHDGCITGKVTSRRRYCHQRGGMEIPCQLLFVGKQKHIQKLKTLFQTRQYSCIEYLN